MMRSIHVRGMIVLGFIVVFIILFIGRIQTSPDQIFLDDASEYSRAALHLVHDHLYSLDGKSAFIEREPGYSFFLAKLYFLFGDENLAALFIAQAGLYLTAVLLFMFSLETYISKRAGTILLALLLLSPPIFHTIFSAYREIVALSLLTMWSAGFLYFRRWPAWKHAIGLGFLWGGIALTYYPLLLAPIFLGIALLQTDMKKKFIVALTVLPFLLPVWWGFRNMEYTQKFQIIGKLRTTYVWHVRGEQAEQLRGLEPLRCMWSEYISRNWNGRSKVCSFLGTVHAMWPDGRPTGHELEIATLGKQKIIQNFPFYLWFSGFEILELHLPYVNGWGFLYNILAAVYSLLLYAGILFALRVIWRKEFIVFFAFVIYQIAIFSLTEAIPRYLVPVLFCYCLGAALGYDRVLHWVRSRH